LGLGWHAARTDALVAVALCAAAEVELLLAGLGPRSALAAAVATLSLAFRRPGDAVRAAVDDRAE
jgi:hypothetical protein